MDYEIVRYRPEFKTQIGRFLTQLWSPDEATNVAYLEWKYERNPYIHRPLIYLALWDGQVVGMRGGMGAKWEVGQPLETFIAPCTGDLLVAPEHRKRGLVQKMTEVAIRQWAEEGYTYTFGFSAGLVTKLSLLLMGWRNIGSTQKMVWKSSKPRMSLRRLRRRASMVPFRRLLPSWVTGRSDLGFLFGTNERHVFTALDKHSGLGRTNVNKHVSVEHAPRPSSMAELVREIPYDGRFRQVRDEQYFNWRFQSRLSRFRFLYWEDTRLMGYLVLAASTLPGQGLTVRVVDWQGTEKGILADLLYAAIQMGQFKTIETWSATLPDDIIELLVEAGFEMGYGVRKVNEATSATVQQGPVLVRALRPDVASERDWVVAGRSLLDLSNWDISPIFSDMG